MEERSVETYPLVREIAWLRGCPALKDVVNQILHPTNIERFKWPARNQNDNALAAQLTIEGTTAHLASYLRNLLSNSLDVPTQEILDSISKVMEEVAEPRFAGGAREYQHAKRACRQATPAHGWGSGQTAC